MARTYLFWASLSGFVAVALGAFGAHALKDRLDEYHLRVYQLAVQYQFFHTVALGIVGLLLARFDSPPLRYSALAFCVGILVFSGSLYALAVTRVKVLGAITPIGGLAFLMGWALLAFAITKMEFR
jgi:uncharacterized membrane protein YgdD (TMEM256/DUF423 family)